MTEFNIKKVKTVDFKGTILEWCRGHNFPLNLNMLPENTFVYYVEDVPVYSVCFYNTDSYLAWLAYPLSNPFCYKELKEGGLNRLFQYVSEYAKSLNYAFLFTTSNTVAIENELKSTDFSQGDETVNHYFKILE